MPTYLFATLVFIPLWLLIFWRNKARVELLIWSVIGAILGPTVQIIHLKDWWSPTFICSNCIVNIEDILFGFLVAGIGTTIYNSFFVKKESKPRITISDTLKLLLIGVVGLILTFVPFYLFEVHSFYTKIFAFTFISLAILLWRPSSLLPMLVSGFLLMIYSTLFYIVGLVIDPTWIAREWFTNELSGVYLVGVPIEEFIWFFLVGFGFSSLWEAFAHVRYLKKR